MLTTLVATVIVLGVLIFVHELGHFMTAKAVDIEVPRFSIGFGPRILGFRRGETEYVISLLPFGGYVKMAGMEDMEAVEGGDTTISEMVDHHRDASAPRTPRPRDFDAKPVWARAIVISAGVTMNLIFAFVVFAASAMIWGVARVPGTAIGGVNEEYLPEGTTGFATLPRGARVQSVNGREVKDWDGLQRALINSSPGDATIEFTNAPALRIRIPARDSLRGSLVSALEPAVDVEPVLGTVLGDGPAGRAGLRPRDRIVAAEGRTMRSWQEFVAVVERNPDKAVPIVVERDGERLNFTVTPESRRLHDLQYGRIGVAPLYGIDSALPRRPIGPLHALQRGAVQTWDMVTMTVQFLGRMVTGRESARNVGGPIMITQMSGRFVRAGLEAFLGFMAILSVNLAVLNLLPIPVLDGGHLVYLAIEAVRGRALSIEQRMRLAQVVFVILVAIMVWALGNDVMRWFGI